MEEGVSTESIAACVEPSSAIETETSNSSRSDPNWFRYSTTAAGSPWRTSSVSGS